MPAAKRPKFNEFERALIEGMEETLRHIRGEIRLTTTVYPIPAPPPRFSARRIAALRTKLELTPDQLAAVLNTSCRTISDWEKGKRSPGGSALRLLQMLEKNPTLLNAILPATRIRKPMTIQEAENARCLR